VLTVRLGLTHLVGTPALKPYMHGYFLSLKLYSTARVMANPNSYDEHREKLINARMEQKAESRIRAKKEQPKVNKALAERLRRAEASAAKKGDAAASGGVLVDPRFKELFEDPEYEVDEQSREFALLNPATVHNASLGLDGKGRKKTAVEDEEDDSAESSSGLEESEDEEEEGSGEEEDDSDEGDLNQYDPRKLRPDQEKRQLLRAYQYRPQLQAGSSTPGQSSTSSSFGQRLHAFNRNSSKATTTKDPRLDNVLAMRRSGDGGMEVSFVPTGSAKSKARAAEGEAEGDDFIQEEFDGGAPKKRTDKKVDRFGHGMQRGLEEEDGDGQGEGEARSGRTKRRDPGRSASKNAFRKR
jgi:ribosome biogenesis protein ENP2